MILCDFLMILCNCLVILCDSLDFMIHLIRTIFFCVFSALNYNMFSGISNFLFGSSTENTEPSTTETNPSQQPETQDQSLESRLEPAPSEDSQQSQATNSRQCHLKTLPAEDDEWVLVDKSSEYYYTEVNKFIKLHFKIWMTNLSS